MPLSRTVRACSTASALVFALLLVAGCGGDDSSGNHIENSLVSVVGRSGDKSVQGSGVIVDRPQSGLIVTSDHLIEGVDAIDVTFHDGTSTLGRPVARAQCHDLALISVGTRPDDVRPISFADDTTMKPGDAVTAYGYRGDEEEGAGRLVDSEGEVSAVDVRARLDRRLPEVSGLILHQAAVSPELTGGPLTNEDGDLVGVNMLVSAGGASSSSALYKAVSASYFRKALSELRLESNGTYGGWATRHRCHGVMDRLARAARG